jgi:phosphoribosylaminoimidazole-succinocarboxamide synthase
MAISPTMTVPTPFFEAVTATDLALPGGRRGKVRDVYPLPPARAGGEPRLLIAATDRLSAFDVVLPTAVPGKGRLLNQISTFWLRFIENAGLSRTHLISTDVGDVPAWAFKPGGTTREQLAGRLTIGRRCRVIPVECVVRGYLEGSGWKEYKASGSVCGVRLPAGLRQCDRLPEPIFTPSTKAEPPAHDEPVTFEQVVGMVGAGMASKLRDRSLAIYRAASEHARARGIIIADTKFEFGLPVDGRDEPTGDEPIVIDEALTPDSSRFWPADSYQPGRAQASFDKQFVREYLEGLVAAGRWNKAAPGPELPAAVVEGTLAKYREAVERLTA